MRDIKFRAWDKITKKIYIVNSLTLDFKYCDLWNGNKQDEGIAREWNEVELLQYTGLKDKNGKEIYEGDIVTFRHQVNYENKKNNDELNPLCYGVIKYSEAAFHIDDTKLCPYLHNLNIDEIKGNEYENPELLKDK